ncbi:MAG TPA: mechanosensitive ion channel domain-containing protein [Rudaea sp.]|jgi:small-conductance mechanosensitive channel|nr:mechanosensitive ion channel domain-containing protein [Rudaea sp.]
MTKLEFLNIAQAIADLAHAANPPPPERSALRELFDEPYVLPLLKIVGGLVLVIVGIRIGRWLANIERRVLLRAHVDRILAEFLRNISYAVLLALIIVSALEFSGFPTTSLLAALGAAGLAVGLALKDSLANIAAGVLLIVLRPFRVGDAVKIGGQEGVVEGVFIFQTRLHTFDNRDLTFLNSQVIAAPIFNYSQRTTRRSDITLTLAHDADIKSLFDITQKAIDADSRIIKDPPPSVSIADITDRGIVFSIQVWSDAAVMGTMRSDLLMNLQQAFAKDAIGFARFAALPAPADA